MAGGLPPPPITAANGDFVWTVWYQDLRNLLSTAGGVTWALVNKAGSSLADLQSRAHSALQGILGNGSYHLSLAERDKLVAVGGVISKAGLPVIGDIPDGTWAIYKDTTAPFTLRLWSNDAGTLKSVTLL